MRKLLRVFSALMIVAASLSFIGMFSTHTAKGADLAADPPATNPYFSVDPPTYTAIKTGEIFNVSVKINDLDPLWEAVGFEFKLGYNQTILQPLNVWEGPWLPTYGVAPNGGTFFVSLIETDYLHVGNIVLPDQLGVWHAPFPQGSGVLTIVQFNATMQGISPEVLSCPLHLYDALAMNDTSGYVPTATPVDGSYSINGILPATVSASPEILNLKSKGDWFTVYIEILPDTSPEIHNSTNIDVSSIRLNGTISVDPQGLVEIGDYDNNAIPDMKVQFNRTTVCQYILSQGITFGNVTLLVTGNVNDGTPFQGNVTIKVRMPGDTNCDGVVDIYDAIEASNAFGSTPTGGNWNIAADENEDGVVDIFDMVFIARNFGYLYK